MFPTLIVIGLVGLTLMALPAFKGHGHVGRGLALKGHAANPVAHHAGHAPALKGAAPHGTAHALQAAGQSLQAGDHASSADSWLRFVPSPRVIFSLLALVGAFGNALAELGHLPEWAAALVALLPAVAVERLMVNPIWNLLFRFQGKESSPLEMLLFAEARAVTPFRNGRGLVAVNRDGRLVQLSAQLAEDEAQQPVKVGDRLSIEDIDPRRERVTVSRIREPQV